ncbi:hypothetical protein LQV05_005938 [Cryptococcus neoformans]|nr:hypothetical protein LQV05_005938 [Cryptococcus neoformans]
MADSMTLALEHKINNPLESYQKVADLYGVSKSSLYDRHTGVHSSHTASAPRHLSIVQEEELVKKINEYAGRGTLLTPRHVVELAEAVYDGKLGVNWGSRFIQRHCDTIHSRFYKAERFEGEGQVWPPRDQEGIGDALWDVQSGGDVDRGNSEQGDGGRDAKMEEEDGTGGVRGDDEENQSGTG